MSIDTWIEAPSANPLNDPYGQWFEGPGRPFTIADREPKQANEDFSFVFVEKAHTGDFDLLPHNTNGVGRRILAPLRRDSISSNASQTIDKHDTSDMLFPNGIDAIVAVIDDGVNFGHQRFCYDANKTRVAFAWVQDGVADEVASVPFGREWTQTQIDAAIQDSISPDDLLKRLDLVDFTRTGIRTVTRRMSHGTHMTDLATGYTVDDLLSRQKFLGTEVPSGDVDPSRIAVITVQLPFLMTQESSGATYEPFVGKAIEYVLDRAGQLVLTHGQGRKIPTFINLSYAIAGGPHSGESPLSKRISQLLASYNAPVEQGGPGCGGAALFLPSGNRYMERGHAQTQIQDNKASVVLPWRVLPGDQTSSFLEFWIPVQASGTLQLTAPNSASITYTIGDESLNGCTKAGEPLARVSTDVAVEASRKRVMIAIAPTDTHWMDQQERRTPAPSGVWNVQIEIEGCPEDAWVDAWIQRDESPYLYRANALQSYFDDEQYVRFDERGEPLQRDGGNSVLQRGGSLSGLATIESPHVYIVGGKFGSVNEISLDGSSGEAMTKPSFYAAEGFETSRGSGQHAPHFSAVSDRSRVYSGVPAAGTNSGSTVAVTGTSTAAPQIVRWLSEYLLKHPNSDGAILPAIEAMRDVLETDIGPYALRLGAGYLGPLETPLSPDN